MSEKDDKISPEDVIEQLHLLISQLTIEDQVELLEVLKTRRGDQRSSTRKPFFSEVIYTSEKGAHHEFTKDISETGIFIETPMPFKIGEKLSITFPVELLAKHIKLSGVIARKSKNGIGVKFDKIDQDKQTILRHLMENLQ